MHYLATALSIVLFGVLTAPFFVLAQISESEQAIGVAVTRPVAPDARDGDIVVFDAQNNVYRLAVEGDGITGLAVVVSTPVLVLRTSEGDPPIVTDGMAMVNVIASNGPIGLGEAIAPSAVGGKGERADAESRFIIGFARESFSPPEGQADSTSRILVEVAPRAWQLDARDAQEPGDGRDIITLGTARPLFGFLPRSGAALGRFVAAALIAGLSLTVAYRLYAKNLITGIESIGRNPLAGRSIKTMMVANIALIVVVSIAGLAISALIIAL